MSNERAIEVLRAEKKCVLRNIRGCEQECEHCELDMPEMDILAAYDAAIRALEGDDRR